MSYKSLTEQQRSLLYELKITNGCGPEDWRWPKLNWFFKANCLEHDYNYAVGGIEADRRMYDWGFYKAMLDDTRRVAWYARPYARMKAWVFYTIVRLRGKSRFHYGKKRTYQELIDAYHP